MARLQLSTLLFATAVACCSQVREELPFTLTWTEGKCVDCKTAHDLGRIQFTTRHEAWAVGYAFPPPGAQGAGDYAIVYTKDAGRTWRELPQTRQHAVAPTFSFIDARRGWIAWMNVFTGESHTASTSDGGQHWQDVSGQFLQRVRFFDGSHGYGTEGAKFLRTDDTGRTWSETEIPHLRFIDRMFFLNSEIGWLAGSDGKDFFVFRTSNGGRDWEVSRTNSPAGLVDIRDLYFLDKDRGWLFTWQTNDGGSDLFSTVDGGAHWVQEPDMSFQGKGKFASVVRFVSDKTGFVFEEAAGRNRLVYTIDGGLHWRQWSMAQSIFDCQDFEGDLLCSGSRRSPMGILTLHPK